MPTAYRTNSQYFFNRMPISNKNLDMVSFINNVVISNYGIM